MRSNSGSVDRELTGDAISWFGIGNSEIDCLLLQEENNRTANKRQMVFAEDNKNRNIKIK